MRLEFVAERQYDGEMSDHTGNHNRGITQLWAWVSAEQCDEGHSDCEGIIGYYSEQTQGWLPLIGSVREHMEGYRDFINKIVENNGKTVKLINFSTREVVETVNPPDPDQMVIEV